MLQIKWLDPANIWRIQLHKGVRQRPGDSLTGPPPLADLQRCHQEGSAGNKDATKRADCQLMFISGLIIRTLTAPRLLGHMISEINGKNWLALRCAHVMCDELCWEKKYSWTGKCNPTSLLSVKSSQFFAKQFFFAQTSSRLWTAILAPSKPQMLTVSLFTCLLI